MEIKLCGYKVQIDEEDYDRVMALKWWVNYGMLKECGHVYIGHTFRDELTGKKRNITLHRFIMGCTHKDGVIIDHISGDTLDNRKSNLRRCTNAENLRNSKNYVTNTSGYKGVCYVKGRGKYKAQIQYNSKRYNLGYFNTPEEAYIVYCEASKKYHGDFGRVK